MKQPKLYATALRRLKRSRGFGIHSPFAFHFVRRTLGERAPYYAYASIAASRDEALRLARGVSRHPRIMSLKNARMLFRVACRFNPATFFQIGSHFGVSTMALLAVDSRSRLTLYAPANPHAGIYAEVTAPAASRITHATGFDSSFSSYLAGEAAPFILVCDVRQEELPSITAALTRAATTTSCVIAVRNLSRKGSCTRGLWDSLTASLAYGMSFTNGNIGFITALPHLPVQHFTLWF